MKHCRKRVFLAILVGIFMMWPLWAHAAMVLKFSHTHAPDSLEDRCIDIFAEKVAERTKGEIKIQVFPSSQLGGTLVSFQGLTVGTIDFHFIDTTVIGYNKGHEEFFVGWVPYLFNTVEDARRIYNSELFAPFYERVRKEKGIRTLAKRGDRAPRALNTTKGPIFEPKDCKGIKIRAVPLPVAIKAAEAWGFKATPVNFSELFMALKQGVVDGQDNGLDVTVPLKFHEVAKYFALSDHTHSVYGWFMSEKTWNKIPAKSHSILEEEAKAAGDLITELGEKRQQEDLNILLKNGVKVTIPNRFAFREASKDVYKEYEGKLWPAGLVEKIRGMQKK